MTHEHTDERTNLPTHHQVTFLNLYIDSTARASLFVVLSSFSSVFGIYILHTSFPLGFGHPLVIFPGMSTSNILRAACSPFILISWSYHFSRYYRDNDSNTCMTRLINYINAPNRRRRHLQSTCVVLK